MTKSCKTCWRGPEPSRDVSACIRCFADPALPLYIEHVEDEPDADEARIDSNGNDGLHYGPMDHSVQAVMDATTTTWQPMGLAPEDGTAVLALLNDSDVPHAVRYVDDGWEMVWDQYRLSSNDGPRYWMPIANDPDA
jgi:hypothetical protein